MLKNDTFFSHIFGVMTIDLAGTRTIYTENVKEFLESETSAFLFYLVVSCCVGHLFFFYSKVSGKSQFKQISQSKLKDPKNKPIYRSQIITLSLTSLEQFSMIICPQKKSKDFQKSVYRSRNACF